MAITSFPFDSGDTTESQYSRLFRELQDDGVAADFTSAAFRVSADGSGMDVQIAPGFAVIRGHAVSSTAIETITLPAADAQPRIDRIVLRLDPTLNTISIAHLRGTAAATPLAPAVEQTDAGIYEVNLADIHVAAELLNVSQTNITDRRPFIGSRNGIWSTPNRPGAPRMGKMGFNTTTLLWEFWDGSKWESINKSRTIRVPHTWTVSGEVKLQSGDDFFIPPFFVPAPAGQSVRVVGGRCRIRSGSSAKFRIATADGGAAMHAALDNLVATTSAPGFNVTGGVAVGNEQSLYLVVTEVNGTPKNLTVTLYLDYTA